MANDADSRAPSGRTAKTGSGQYGVGGDSKPQAKPTKKSPTKATPTKATPARSGGAAPTALASGSPGATGELAQFINAIMREESGGNYRAVGPDVHGDHAYGKYQIMGANIPSWSREILGRSVSIQEYLNSPQIQEQIAQGKLTQYYNKYGAAGAASAWFTGSPTKYKTNPNASDGGTTAARYVNNVLAMMGQQPTTIASAASGTASAVKGDSAPALPAYQADPGMSIESYGFIKALAATEPDINRLMREYANQDLSSSAVAARLEADLRDTHWYKTHSAGERQQEVLKATDPNEYRRKYDAAQKQMQTVASQLGVQLGAEGLTRLTKHYLAEGWSQQQVNQFLVQFGAVAQGGHGTLQATADALRQRATDYMVPVSQAAAQKWAQDIAAGVVDQNAYDAYLKEQAKSLFPTLAPAIDRGVTVKTYTDPYRNVAAQTLELDPESIDFMNDPKYQKALYQIDPKTKDRTPMSLADWGTYLRTLPEYAKTHQANEQAASMANSILNVFGKVAS